jgi:hypothetical protein
MITRSGIQKTSKEQILAYTLLFSTFFVALRVGFEEIVRIPTQITFVIYSIYYLLSTKRVIKSDYSYYYLIVTPAFLVTQFFISILVQETIIGGVSIDAFAWFLKYLLFYILVALTASVVNSEQLLSAYLKVGYWSLPFVYLSYIASSYFGFSLGADYWQEGWVRPHGFFSEPSNLSYYLPGLLIHGFIKKSKFMILIAAFTIMLVMSPTVYAVSVLSLLTYFYYRGGRIFKIGTLITAICIIVIMVNFGKMMHASLEGSGAILHSLSRLIEGFLRFGSDADAYSNSRYDLTLQWSEFIAGNKFILLTGLGFGVSNSYADKFNDGMTFDLSLWTMLINSFGVIGSIFVLGTIFISFAKKGRSSAFNWIYYTIFVASLVNPSGIFWQMLVVVFLLTSLKGDGQDAEPLEIINRLHGIKYIRAVKINS